ncbi:unnamed protein product [Paramecium sonneborni]|uniref:Transmembrane protein n=1 Tax=Paramecium sonneborni TaxID=65129 RepID=A0A8S1RS52_9CILI|nr:unnamed protein product [Paramecium sonneborni]
MRKYFFLNQLIIHGYLRCLVIILKIVFILQYQIKMKIDQYQLNMIRKQQYGEYIKIITQKFDQVLQECQGFIYSLAINVLDTYLLSSCIDLHQIFGRRICRLKNIISNNDIF